MYHVLARADRGANPGGLQHGCQRLVGEHHGEHDEPGRQQRRDQRPGADDPVPSHQDSQQRAAAGHQRSDRDQPGRLDTERERGGHDRQRRRGQSAGDDRAFDQHVGDQCAGGDLAFGAQSVVERHPRGQQHQTRRPHRGLAGRHRRAEPRQHLARQQQPAHQPADQVGQPHPDAGVADVRHQREHVVVPAERVLGAAEPAEVVGHVAGFACGAGHLQDVAVVGGVGADDVPRQEAADHDDVGAGDEPPAGRDEPVHPAAVDPVQAPQREQRDDGGHDRDDHRGELQSRGPGGEPGVDLRGQAQPGRRGPGQVGEYADDRRPQVRVVEPAAQRLARRDLSARRTSRTCRPPST